MSFFKSLKEINIQEVKKKTPFKIYGPTFGTESLTSRQKNFLVCSCFR